MDKRHKEMSYKTFLQVNKEIEPVPTSHCRPSTHPVVRVNLLPYREVGQHGVWNRMGDRSIGVWNTMGGLE